MFNIAPPDPSELDRFLERQAGAPYSYPGVGGSRRGVAPPGYDRAAARVVVGRGAEAFAAARTALARFAMFPDRTRVRRPAGDPEAGRELAVGLWWLNGARVVYVEDEPRRYAFAYGTLPSHAARGEERFAVEWGKGDTVVFELRSFSRPRLLAARLALPVTRALQRRFVRDSLARMAQVVA